MSQKIISGVTSYDEIGKIIKEYGTKKFMLV